MLSSAPRVGATIVALTLAALIAGCGGDDDTSKTGTGSGSQTTTSAVDKQIAAQVPAALKSKGTLTVAADASYPRTSSSPPTARPSRAWTPTSPRRSPASWA